MLEVRGGRTPEHREAPEDDGESEHPRSRDAVGEHAERQRRHRADEGADGDEQSDVRVGDVQARAELARRGADRRGVGAAQAEDRGEDDDDVGALLAAERDRQPPRDGARRGGSDGHGVGEYPPGARFLGAHDPMVAAASTGWASDVPAHEQDGCDQERSGAVGDEDEAARDGSERVRGVMEREDLPPCLARQVLGDRVVPARREREHQRRQDEEDRREGRDSAGRVPHDRADREREDPDEHHVDRAADHRPRDAGVRERDLELRDVVEDRLAREEADEHGREHEDEGDDRVVDDLRPQHRKPSRHGGERRADRAGRVLRADQQDAEHRDRELRDVDAGERDVERMPSRAIGGRHRAPVRPGDEREEDGEERS